MKETARIAVRGSVLRVISLAATTLVAFFMMPFLVHRLGDHVYGYWVLAGTILGYYGLMDLGIVSAVQFYVAKALGEDDPASANRAISTAFFAFAALGLAITLITVVVALFSHVFIRSSSDASVFRAVLLIMGCGFAVGFPGRAFVGALSAYLRWDLISSIGVGVLLFRTVIIVAVINAGWGIVSLAAVTVSSDVLTYAFYYFVLKHIRTEFRLSATRASLKALKEVFRYSAITLIVKISDQLRFYIDVFVVSAILSVGAVTHYAIASRLALSYRELMIALFGILSPLFSQWLGSKDYLRTKRVFVISTKLSLSVGAMIASGMILYGRGFIELWMGKDYLDAYWPLVFLASGVFFEISQIPAMGYMYGTSKHHFLAYMNLVEGSFNAILSICLARKYGMKGVALGTLIPMAVAWFLIQPLYVCRQIGLPIRVFYTNIFGRATGVTVIGMLLPWFLCFSWFTQAKFATFVPFVACQTIIALAVSYLFAFGTDERADILRALFPEKHRRSINASAELQAESLV